MRHKPNHCDGNIGLLIAGCFFAFGSTIGSQSQVMALDAEGPAETRVVAQVNGQPIYELEIARELKELPGSDKATGDSPQMRSAVLKHVIDRQLVLEALQKAGHAASQQEVDLQVDRLKQRVEAQGEPLDDYLRKRSLNEPSLRRTIAWRLTWQRYADRYLTEENVQRFFSQHRCEFDGTQMRVAHILWKVNDPDDEAGLQRVKQAAADVRTQITSGDTTFAEMAKLHSAAPSADDGGELGFIERRQPMAEAFSRAAFALDAGEISGPVVTPAGVHLIQCLEIRPGTRTRKDVGEELRKAAARYLFEWLAQRARKGARIHMEESSDARR